MLCGLQTKFLQNNAYQLILPRFQLVQYYSTNFILPNIVLPPSKAASPFSDVMLPGDKISYGELSYTFIVDEDMKNYEEIYNWMKNISFAESFEDFQNYRNKDEHQKLGQQDATLVVLSSKGNPIRQIVYKDAFPVSLSGAQMTTIDPDTNYVTATLTMAYTNMEII